MRVTRGKQVRYSWSLAETQQQQQQQQQ